MIQKKTFIISIITLILIIVTSTVAMGEFIPPDPLNIINDTGALWINHSWDVQSGSGGSEWYLLDGDESGGLYGFNWSGTAWQSDSAITNDLPSFGSYSSPEVFKKDDNTYLFVGSLTSSIIQGYNWSASSWHADSAIVSGLTGFSTSQAEISVVFEFDDAWYAIIGMTASPPFYGYKWNGTTWISNSTIISGLPTSFKFFPTATVFEMDSTWYLIHEDMTGVHAGYNWTGSTWQVDPTITVGYPGEIGSALTPYVFQKEGINYLITGDTEGSLHGFNWTGSAWQADSAITGGLGSTGNNMRIVSAFEIDSPEFNVTNSYNISVNGVWYNGSTDLFYNDTYSIHGWQNITVWAYNSSSSGTLSENSISQNTQVTNNPILLTNVSASYSLNESETFTLDANYTDADNDTAVFSDNSSNWTINSATGEVSWLTTSDDVGTHYYRITVDDGHGGTDYQDFTIIVIELVEILSTNPTGDFDLDANGAQELSLELNFNATSVWYVDEIETQTDHNTTTPEYYFTTSVSGVYNVTCVSTDPINGSSESFTWLITVTSSEAVTPPSIYAPPPKKDRPIIETIEDYVPAFWYNYDGVEDVVEDIKETITTEIPDEKMWWIVILLIILLLVAYYYKD